MRRYVAQWRRPYRIHSLRRLTPETLENRAKRRAVKMIRRALSGDLDALVYILKATGDLPEDYKLSD